MPRHLKFVTVVIALLFVTSACSSSGDDAAVAPSPAPGSATGAITVSAAASLTESFNKIKDDFTRDNPNATVSVNFGSSGQLSTQIQQGAPADVAAFADEAPMNTLDTVNLLTAPPKVFARNRLVIVTEPGNPKAIESTSDLADVGTVSLCAATAPCGKFADQILENDNIDIPTTQVTRGQDVKATLSAVTEGDAEAAIVYVTDARAAGDAVTTVQLPETSNVVANYPVAVVKASTNASTAQAFEDYVLGPRGRAILVDAGFLVP